MSVVAAKVYKDKIIMCADSIIVRGTSKRNTNFSKIAKINDMIVGGVGYCEDISMMWHYMQTHKPASPTEKDVLTFFIEFTEWKNKMGLGTELNSEFLLIYKEHLFKTNGLFVHEIKDFVAIGAGEDFATAALYLGHSPKESVEVACKLSCYVCEPVVEYQEEIEENKS